MGRFVHLGRFFRIKIKPLLKQGWYNNSANPTKYKKGHRAKTGWIDDVNVYVVRSFSLGILNFRSYSMRDGPFQHLIPIKNTIKKHEFS